MTRVNIYDDGRFVGWFDPAKARERILERQEWDGKNNYGAMSRLYFGYEELLLTAQGRWVRHYNARPDNNGPEYWEYLTEDQAREWLLRENSDKANEVLERYFGPIPEESGPNLGGRPEIGPEIKVRVTEEMRNQIDAYAADHHDGNRASAVRRLLEHALTTVDA